MKSDATRKLPTQQAILRSVASSTAIETGKCVKQLELKLKQASCKFHALKLAR